MPECAFCNHQAKTSKDLEEHVWEIHSNYLMGE